MYTAGQKLSQCLLASYGWTKVWCALVHAIPIDTDHIHDIIALNSVSV